ncbi:MAG: phenylalanine--tRNA ligase subunit beta, partial [Ferruginibacter sp.]
SPNRLEKQDIRHDVFFADLLWEELLEVRKEDHTFKEIPRYPAVRRDLAIVVNNLVPFSEIKKTTDSLKVPELLSMELFDIFESGKLGNDKKSIAVNYTFIDEGRTLTDEAIDKIMNQLIHVYENELGAEIRK